MDFLIMIVAAVIAFGKLAAKSEGEGNKKRTQNVGPTAEEWAERLRQSAAGGEVSDKLNSAVNALKKSPRRPSGRDIEAEQARRNAAERHHSEKRWAEARRQQAGFPARPRRRRRQLRGPSREPEGPLRRRHPRPRGVHTACRARQIPPHTPSVTRKANDIRRSSG